MKAKQKVLFLRVSLWSTFSFGYLLLFLIPILHITTSKQNHYKFHPLPLSIFEVTHSFIVHDHNKKQIDRYQIASQIDRQIYISNRVVKLPVQKITNSILFLSFPFLLLQPFLTLFIRCPPSPFLHLKCCLQAQAKHPKCQFHPLHTVFFGGEPPPALRTAFPLSEILAPYAQNLQLNHSEPEWRDSQQQDRLIDSYIPRIATGDR